MEDSGTDPLALKLYEACEKGNEAAVRRLARSIVTDLTVRASIDTRFQDGATALWVACKAGATECARVMLSSRAKATITSSAGYSCLWIAAREGRVGIIELLLQDNRGLLNTPAQDGRTPLYIACEQRQQPCVEALIGAKADLEVTRRDGSTALIVSAYSACSPCGLLRLTCAAADVCRVAAQWGTSRSCACCSLRAPRSTLATAMAPRSTTRAGRSTIPSWRCSRRHTASVALRQRR